MSRNLCRIVGGVPPRDPRARMERRSFTGAMTRLDCVRWLNRKARRVSRFGREVRIDDGDRLVVFSRDGQRAIRVYEIAPAAVD